MSPSQDAASLAQQSKARSSSFRTGSGSGPSGPLSPGPGSPEGATAPEIYRKQVARIEELEKENERLTKDNSEAEERRSKAEEALEELRESAGKAESGDEVLKLVRLRSPRCYLWRVLTI